MTSVLSPIPTDVLHPQVPALPAPAVEDYCPGWCQRSHDQGGGVDYETKTDTWKLLHSAAFGKHVRLFAGSTVDAAGNALAEEPARLEVAGQPDWMNMDTATELGSHLGAALLEVRDNSGAEPGTKFGESRVLKFLSLIEDRSEAEVDCIMRLLQAANKSFHHRPLLP